MDGKRLPPSNINSGLGETSASHTGLPVSGYRAQSQASVDLVNEMKCAEEAMLRKLDEMKESAEIDQRWLAIGRTSLEQAFMAINRSVFKPSRIKLPGE